MSIQFSRRDFIKGSIVMAVGAMSAGALTACAGRSSSSSSASSQAGGTVTLRRGYGVTHGEKCFGQAVVATAEDGTILAVSVDDYQFMDATTEGLAPVPNADKDFGQGFAAGKTLISKSDNDEVYSALIKKSANSTQNWLASIQAIEAYCVGKTPNKIQSAGTDAVSGATLVDTNGYLKLIAQVAQDDTITVQGTYTGDGSDLKLGRTNAACHGTKAFGDAGSLVQGSTLVATNIDEFQFFDATTAGLTPVPNSDKGFGQGYAEGKVLASKAANNTVYSQMMKEKAQATTPWLDSMTAIENALAGKSVDQVKLPGPDAVSGATLVDTAAYAKAAQTAAQAA